MIQAFETRSDIKARIMREAAREWGLKGVNDIDLNAFDPIIDLMMGACSMELEKLSHDVANSRLRIFDRMVEVLTPEILSSAQPAHSIFHAHPVEAKHITKTNEQFFYKSVEHKKDIYFAPLDEFKVVDAKIKTMAFNDRLYRVNERLEKAELAQTQYGQQLPYGSVYIGIEANPHIRSLKDFTFFVDWPSAPSKNEMLHYFATAQWYIKDHQLTKYIGHNHEVAQDEHQTVLDAFGFSSIITKKVHTLTKPHFITIDDDTLKISEVKCAFPSIFNTSFDDTALAQCKDDLIWIEIKLPPVLVSHLSEMQILLNCFPIINRKLVEKQDKLEGLLHIIPLELLDEYFVGIESVHNSAQVPYSEIAIKDVNHADYGMYALRTSGIKRFDSREAKDMMEYILGLLTSEAAAFKGVAYSALSSDFKELEQVFTRIKKNVTLTSKEIEGCYFLFAKPFLNDNMIYIQYWTSDGDKANWIPRNTLLKLFKNANYQANSCTMITATQSGKAPKKNEESIHQFKEAVLSRNRVVTIEDIKKMCWNEMGSNNIRTLKVNKGILLDKTGHIGLRNCIYVTIDRNPASALTKLEYQQMCYEVERILNESSMGVYPIKIVKTENASMR